MQYSFFTSLLLFEHRGRIQHTHIQLLSSTNWAAMLNYIELTHKCFSRQKQPDYFDEIFQAKAEQGNIWRGNDN